MRELNYTVGIDRVDPSGILFGGQQGEHNATKINITLTEDLVSALVDCNNYRFEAEDGAGARRIINKGAYSNEESLSCLIPQYVTSSGGTVTVHLVFVQTDGNGEAEKICWSVAMRMRFERNISDNGYSDDEGIDDVQLLVEECKTSATAAQNAQSEAEKAKEAAETAKENTENLLNDAETGLASKVDKSQIVSKISYPTDIPNGGAVLALGEDLIRTNSVSSIEEQSLNDEAKALARSNIDAIGKQDLLKYYNLSFDGTELPAEVDLNTCVTPGTYYYNQFALTAQNMPSEWEYLSHFKLIVSKSNYIVRQVIQPGSTDQAPLITPGGCGEYMRELDAAMGTWTDWLWSLPIDPNSLTYVDYKNNQSLSDAQKALARSNIGAVSDGDVVSNCVSDGNLLSDKIPNAYAMYEFLKSYAVVANVTQSLTDEQKQTARTNIDAVSVDDVDNVIHDALNKAIENGEIQGIKGEDGISATHRWNGTVLTITSASGTSSSDLKGEKGDTGPQGPAGADSVVDATLTQSGQAADAKATGDTFGQLKSDLDYHEAYLNGGIVEKIMPFELNQNNGFDSDGNESDNRYWSTGIQKVPDGAKYIHYKGTVYNKSILYFFDENKACIAKFGTFTETGTEEQRVNVENAYKYFAVQTNSATQSDAICDVLYNATVEGLNATVEGLNAGKVDINGTKQVRAENIEFVDRKSNNIFDNTKYFIGYMWQDSKNDFAYNDDWAFNSVSDFIPVDNTIPLRTLSVGYRLFAEYDENKNILRMRNKELSAGTPVTLNSDVYYIRFSFDTVNVNSEMLYQSDERLYEYEPYNIYKIDKDYLYESDTDYNKLSIPHVFYKLKGYPLFIHNEQILLESGKPLFASLGRNLNSVSGLYQTKNKSVYVNDNELSSLYYELKSDALEKVIDVKETSFKVSDKDTDNGKIIIHSVGDSFTDINTQYKWIYDNVPNIEFVGLLKSKNTGLRHDGRTGRTLEWFCTVFKKNTTGSDAGVSVFMHPVNNQYKYYGTLNYWKYVKNSESFATIVDEIGIDSETGLRNNPNVNDLMYDGDNQTFIFWNGSSWENVSDETVGEFAFSYAKYLEVYGIHQPDIVCIQLGTNDYMGYKREDIDQKNYDFSNYLETMVSSIHDVSSDIKIIICVPPKGSMKEEYAQGDRYRANLNMMDCRTTIIDNFDGRESDNIYVVDSGASIDGYSDFGVIGEYSSDSDRYPSWSQGLVKDGTHVNQNGFEKIGQSIGACIQYIR